MNAENGDRDGRAPHSKIRRRQREESLTGNPQSAIASPKLIWGKWRLAVAERRKTVAHGETVGERTRLNQAPDGAKGICAGWFSVAPAGALVAG